MKIVVWSGCTVEAEHEIIGLDVEVHVDPYAKLSYVYDVGEDE